MRRHVVRPFVVVNVGGVAVRRKPREHGFQVAANIRVGVLAKNERGAGVLQEHMTEPGADAAAGHETADLIGDLGGPAAAGGNA